MKIFIIKSHDGRLLGKDLAWVDGANANLIFRLSIGMLPLIS